MNRQAAAAPHWRMPWLAPVVLSGLYLIELWREGAAAEPMGLLIQMALAAPLVLAATVLLAVGEQEIRIHSVTARLRGWLRWTPRAILLLFIAFLAILSLDVFVEGYSAGEIAIGLLMHNLPALALLAITIAAWRRPWVGALGLIAFTVWWLVFFTGRGFPPSVFLLMAILPLTVGTLFLLSWVLKGDNQ